MSEDASITLDVVAGLVMLTAYDDALFDDDARDPITVSLNPDTAAELGGLLVRAATVAASRAAAGPMYDYLNGVKP